MCTGPCAEDGSKGNVGLAIWQLRPLTRCMKPTQRSTGFQVAALRRVSCQLSDSGECLVIPVKSTCRKSIVVYSLATQGSRKNGPESLIHGNAVCRWVSLGMLAWCQTVFSSRPVTRNCSRSSRSAYGPPSCGLPLPSAGSWFCFTGPSPRDPNPSEGRGLGVIERLAHDLQVEFPGVEGYSPRSLKYMRSFAES